MKIRTNFVTNSSSYSSAEIKIDNPVLLEMLEKYKKLGTFKTFNDPSFDDNHGEKLIAIGCSDNEANKFLERYYQFNEQPYTIYYEEDEQAEVYFGPKTIEDVTDCIFDLLQEKDGDENIHIKNWKLFNKLKKEVELRSEEINKSYKYVSWEAENASYGEFEPDKDEETSWKFLYKDNEI